MELFFIAESVLQVPQQLIHITNEAFNTHMEES